jgi:DNA-binding transcriptional LysR family regulator
MREVDDPRFFVTIVLQGSLAAAARALDVTPSAITQRLQSLEAKLGVRLVDRGSRKLRLTDEGELYYNESAAITSQYDALIDALQARRSLVRGHLRILATLGFGRRYLAKIIADFQGMHPQLEVTMTLTDRIVEDTNAPYDVIVFIGELKDSSRVAYRVAPNERYLLASPAYLRRMGTPQSPEALVQHECLVLRENDEDVTLWRFQKRGTSSRGAKGGNDVGVRVSAKLSSNDGDVIKQWAVAGRGIMIRSEWDSRAEVESGKLIPLLTDWLLPAGPIVALVPQRSGLSARTKAFIEYLVTQFQPAPPWRVNDEVSRKKKS